jgi:hypothetical protein
MLGSKDMIKNSNIMTTAAIILATIFASSLYLQMSTASLYDNYQIGISKIRIFHPGLLILLVLLLTIIVPGKAGKTLSAFSILFGKMAVGICIGLGALYAVFEFYPSKSQWSLPHERTLTSTIILSLTHPEFSNRSLIGLIYTAPLAVFLIWVSKRIYRKKYNLSLKRDRESRATLEN